MMPACVAVRSLITGLPVRDDLLRHPWQRIKFAEQADDRLLIAESGREGCRHTGNRAFDFETGVLKHARQERRGFFFLVAGLGPIPYFQGGLPRRFFASTDRLVERRLLGATVGYRQERENDNERPYVSPPTTHDSPDFRSLAIRPKSGRGDCFNDRIMNRGQRHT